MGSIVLIIEDSCRKNRNANDSANEEAMPPMPMGGAGLMRFYQDASNGFKIGPIVVVVLVFF